MAGSTDLDDLVESSKKYYIFSKFKLEVKRMIKYKWITCPSQNWNHLAIEMYYVFEKCRSRKRPLKSYSK